MDNNESPSSKRFRKESPKNPSQVSQPPPPSQFHQQEPLQQQPPRGLVITYTSPRPVVHASRGLMIPLAARPDATMRARTSNELGFMGGLQTSMDQSFQQQHPQKQVSTNQSFHHHHQNQGRPSFFQDRAISQALLPDLSLWFRPINPQGSSSFGDFSPLLQPLTGQISTSSTQSTSSSSTLAPVRRASRGLMIPPRRASRGLMIPPEARPAATIRARPSNDQAYYQRRQQQAHMSEFYRQLSQWDPNMVQPYHRPHQNQPTLDQDHQNRGIKRSRSSFYNDGNLSLGSSSMVKPQGSSSSFNNFNSNPKDVRVGPSNPQGSSSETVDASRGLISPETWFDPTERAKTLNELGFMGDVQTSSMDQSYYHQHPQNQVSTNQSFHQNQVSMDQSYQQHPQNQVSMDQSFYHSRPSSSTVGPSDPQGSSSSTSFNNSNSNLEDDSIDDDILNILNQHLHS